MGTSGIPCKDKSFDEILIDEENKKILRECISELKDIYKETLMLRYFHDLKFDEIAKILNISVGAAKQRIERAKQILYNMLKDRM